MQVSVSNRLVTTTDGGFVQGSSDNNKSNNSSGDCRAPDDETEGPFRPSFKLIISCCTLLVNFVVVAIIIGVLESSARSTIHKQVESLSQDRVLTAAQTLKAALDRNFWAISGLANATLNYPEPTWPVNATATNSTREQVVARTRFLSLLVRYGAEAGQLNSLTRLIICRYRVSKSVLRSFISGEYAAVDVHASDQGVYRGIDEPDVLRPGGIAAMDYNASSLAKIFPSRLPRVALPGPTGLIHGLFYNVSYLNGLYGPGTRKILPVYARSTITTTIAVDYIAYATPYMVFQPENPFLSSPRTAPRPYCTSSIHIHDLSDRLLQNLVGGPRARSYVVDNSSNVISFSHGPTFERRNFTGLVPPGCIRTGDRIACFYNLSDHAPYQLLREGASQLPLEHRGPPGVVATARLDYDGQEFIVHALVINTAYPLSFKLYFFVPENYFSENIEAARIAAIGLAVGLALLMTLAGYAVLHIVSAPVRGLAARMARDPWQRQRHMSSRHGEGLRVLRRQRKEKAAAGGDEKEERSAQRQQHDRQDLQLQPTVFEGNDEKSVSGDGVTTRDDTEQQQQQQIHTPGGSSEASGDSNDNANFLDRCSRWLDDHLPLFDEVNQLEEEFASFRCLIDLLRPFMNHSARRFRLGRALKERKGIAADDKNKMEDASGSNQQDIDSTIELLRKQGSFTRETVDVWRELHSPAVSAAAAAASTTLSSPTDESITDELRSQPRSTPRERRVHFSGAAAAVAAAAMTQNRAEGVGNVYTRNNSSPRSPSSSNRLGNDDDETSFSEDSDASARAAAASNDETGYRKVRKKSRQVGTRGSLGSDLHLFAFAAVDFGSYESFFHQHARDLLDAVNCNAVAAATPATAAIISATTAMFNDSDGQQLRSEHLLLFTAATASLVEQLVLCSGGTLVEFLGDQIICCFRFLVVHNTARSRMLVRFCTKLLEFGFTARQDTIKNQLAWNGNALTASSDGAAVVDEALILRVATSRVASTCTVGISAEHCRPIVDAPAGPLERHGGGNNGDGSDDNLDHSPQQQQQQRSLTFIGPGISNAMSLVRQSHLLYVKDVAMRTIISAVLNPPRLESGELIPAAVAGAPGLLAAENNSSCEGGGHCLPEAFPFLVMPKFMIGVMSSDFVAVQIEPCRLRQGASAAKVPRDVVRVLPRMNSPAFEEAYRLHRGWPSIASAIQMHYR